MTNFVDADPTITIRLATEADIPALIDLERQSPTSAHWSEEQYRSFFSEQPRLLLLGHLAGNNRPAGFLVAHQIATEWELENIVVAPAEQRKGLGRQLLAALVSRARDSNGEAVFLEVRASSAAVRALYEKNRFRQTGLRKSYYQNPLEDAILYRLVLDEST
jgi:[ribosomal protein S18]-alanine N-acetyltransferase